MVEKWAQSFGGGKAVSTAAPERMNAESKTIWTLGAAIDQGLARAP
jgi:hypothetical protein